MTLDAKAIAEGRTPVDPGRFKISYDPQSIHLYMDMVDRDLVATEDRDGHELYTTGDVAEWFIGTPPRHDPDTGELLPGDYLELHVAPNGTRNALRWIRPGLIEPMPSMPFTAEVALRGTLNDATDTDEGWSVRFTLPWDTLRQLAPGVQTKLQPGPASDGRLSILVARYNYSHQLPYRDNGNAGPELTMWPPQPRTAFHLRPFHAPLHFAPAAEPSP
jgi:hypothetical protein